MERFTAKLEAAPRGGHYVIVPAKAAGAIELAHGARVRGALGGAPYRSSVMKQEGAFYLGVHKATLAKAGAAAGDRVEITIELDDAPLPGDVVPDDLAAALEASPAAKAAFDRLSPSHKREHVAHVLDAKRPETRARRIAKTITSLVAPKR